MKKLYEELELEVIRFNAEDVITESAIEDDHCAGSAVTANYGSK